MDEFATADLFDAYGDALGVVCTPYRDFGGRSRFCGPVRTVKAYEDNTLVREALGSVGGGAILVVDGGASMQRAMLGDRLGRLAVDNGWSGVLVNGCVRDAKILRELPLGIRALGTNPRKTEKRAQGIADVPVELDGVRVQPGMWLYADEDGIVLSATRLG